MAMIVWRDDEGEVEGKENYDTITVPVKGPDSCGRPLARFGGKVVWKAMKRMAKWTCLALLLCYLIQLLFLGFLYVRPVERRDFPDVGASVTLKRAIYDLHFVPGLGFLLAMRPENYVLTLRCGEQVDSTQVDLRMDVDFAALRVIKDDGWLVLIEQGGVQTDPLSVELPND
jgi:hypothetical protein